MFGDVVRAHRRRAGWTQEELAEKTGLSVRSIGKLEAGRIAAPRPPTVRLLADAFELAGAERDRFCQAASGTSTLRRAVPAQLPADLYGFTGRVAPLARLDALLGEAERPGTVVITAVSGTAGVGKSALAVHWAHRVRDRFPDGQLYVNLRGFDPTGIVLQPATAVHGFLEALDVPPRRVPADLDGKTALYRSLVADRRMLIVLDNARDAAQVRPLLPGAAGCLVLVTSRSPLTALVAADGAHPLPLDLLSVAEAHEVLRRRLGSGRVTAEPQAVDRIVASCARVPLALSIVAARTATDPRLSLTALAAELDDARTRLDVLADADPAVDVRAVLSWSYRALSPAAARLFRQLGLHPGPDIAAAAAAGLAGLATEQVRPLLTELCDAHLVQEHRPGRYAFHDLLRAYAAEQAHTEDPEPDRAAAVGRLLDHYLHSADSAAQLLHLARDPIALTPPRPGAAPERHPDAPAALGWFTSELQVLLALVQHAAGTGFDRHATQLAWTLAPHLDRRGDWLDLVATQQAALTAAVRLDDPSAEARVRRALGRACRLLRRYDTARDHLQQSLDLEGRQPGNETGAGNSHHELSLVSWAQGQIGEALHHAELAHELYRACGNLRGQASSLNSMGWYQALSGEHDRALRSCEQALAFYQDSDDRRGQAYTRDSLGYIHHQLGDHARAVECYERALAGYRELGDRLQEAATLVRLGESLHATGGIPQTRAAWRQAATILEDLDDPEAEDVRARLGTLGRPGR
jgi:tetratricopeptide (TPR) repeat protein/transcriptional regulator with XRE-family HTH domain